MPSRAVSLPGCSVAGTQRGGVSAEAMLAALRVPPSMKGTELPARLQSMLACRGALWWCGRAGRAGQMCLRAPGGPRTRAIWTEGACGCGLLRFSPQRNFHFPASEVHRRRLTAQALSVGDGGTCRLMWPRGCGSAPAPLQGSGAGVRAAGHRPCRTGQGGGVWCFAVGQTYPIRPDIEDGPLQPAWMLDRSPT